MDTPQQFLYKEACKHRQGEDGLCLCGGQAFDESPDYTDHLVIALMSAVYAQMSSQWQNGYKAGVAAERFHTARQYVQWEDKPEWLDSEDTE